MLYLPRDPAPSAINSVVHEIHSTLTGLLYDVTGNLNSNFTVAFNGEWQLVASYGSCAAGVISEVQNSCEAVSCYQPQFDETRIG